MYIDGVLDVTNFNYTNSGSMVFSGSAIGSTFRTPPVNFYPGSVDDLRTYTRVLSAADVKTLYQYTGNQLGFFKMSHLQGE